MSRSISNLITIEFTWHLDKNRNNAWMAKDISKKYPGVYALLIVNLVVFLFSNVLQLNLTGLYLNHASPKIYQWVTSLFCHANFAHLSGNLFFLYIFGRLIEEEEGVAGVVISYFICGLGASLFDHFLSSQNVLSLGASGAIFGLFTISILLKFKMQFSSFVELFVLVPFVFQTITSEIGMLNKNDNIGHDVHVYGALIGVFLIMGLHYLQKKA